MKRIGIYAGAFDPVHAGHTAFALQSLAAAKLDAVYFLPERRPRNKQGVEHFGHRVAMLRQAAKPHVKLGVLELVDISFSIERTLPKLTKQFKGSQLVFLFGSNVVPNLPDWPHVERLLEQAELVIGVRGNDSAKNVKQQLKQLQAQPQSTIVLDSFAPHVSSGRIRLALRRRRPVHGLLQSVARYSNRHWLYVSLRQADR